MARQFGATWWGRAWVEALEQRGSIDANRLPRGRTYARQDRATEVETLPGEIRARVQGTRRAPYRVVVRVRRFDDTEWDRFLTAVAAKAAHAAALLDGDLDPGIVEDARAVGVELLPGAGDLQPRCSCPDWADPCKHSAAVCYLVADELDTDPFALLTLRGRRRLEILAALRRLRSTPPAASPPLGAVPAPVRAGMRASEAWARHPGDLPVPPSPRSRPGSPAVWPVDPPRDAPFTAAGLRALAADAAERAWLAYRGEGTTGLTDDFDTDLTRRAASALGTADWSQLVVATGADPRRLARRAIAWREGGVAGAKATEAPPWRTDAQIMAAARQDLTEAGAPASQLRTRLNTLTVDDVQVRLGGDGMWWRFERRGGAWELASSPSPEPDDLWL
ncbi:SWIM zinc finger family protein [soil metagenome]